MDFTVSTNKSKLNLPLIHGYLSEQSYWAKGRSYEAVKTTIENSLCFGLYENDNNQVGFARVVTDKAAFAYLMDVFILDGFRGKGLGKMLLKAVLAHPDLQVKLFLLATEDSHKFYNQYGFKELTEVHRYMEIRDSSRP